MVDSVEIDGELATADICYFDNLVLFDVADPNNPADDIVFNEAQESAQVRWDMRLLNGRWLLFDGVELKRLDGGDLCGF